MRCNMAPGRRELASLGLRLVNPPPPFDQRLMLAELLSARGEAAAEVPLYT
jgi:hypothetical protein